MNNNEVVGLVIVGGLILWGVSQSKKSGGGGGGGGGGNGPSIGAFRQGGVIGQVTVSQPLTKNAGETIKVAVLWNPATTVDGVIIPWDYRVNVQLGHATAFGWRRANELGFSTTGAPSILVTGKGAGVLLNIPSMTAPADKDQLWDIRAQIQSADRIEGSIPPKPGATFTDVAYKELVGAVKTLVPTAFVAGALLGTVTVSQTSRRLLGLRG